MMSPTSPLGLRLRKALLYAVAYNGALLVAFVSITVLTGSSLWGWVAFIGAIGAAVGSFTNLAIHRHGRGIDLNNPPSHCESCTQPIPKRYDIPIIGWLLLRGRCSSCGATIGWHHIVVELIFASLFALAAWSIASALAVRLSLS